MTTATYYDQYTVLNLSAYSYAQTSPDLGINLNGSKDFSVDAWVNFNGLCSSTSIIAKEGVFEFGLWGNTVFMQITGYAPAMCDPESTTLDDGDWHYICATYDTSGGVRCVGNQQKRDTFVKERSGGMWQRCWTPGTAGCSVDAIVKSELSPPVS